MDTKALVEISENAKDKSNKDLIESRDILLTEFDKTKELIINLTRHLEIVESYYEKINTELGKRTL